MHARKGLRMRLVPVVGALAACVVVVVVFASATVRSQAETDKGGLAVRVVPPGLGIVFESDGARI